MCPGITPACAGNTTSSLKKTAIPWDHPRLRGEYWIIAEILQEVKGSPPLARGILCDNAHINKVDRITPACAGNTASGRTARIPYLDHPRLRGEYGDMSCNPQVVMGSPPLARGILNCHLQIFLINGITPACAGNTWQGDKVQPTTKDHPRLRGEYLISQCFDFPVQGSPPLARGIPPWGDSKPQAPGITPACAGNTLKKSLIYNLFPISISKFHLVSQTPEML